MTKEDKLLKLRKLADAMYYAAQQLTTDASMLHKAMDEYHKFIINEYHKEEYKFKAGDVIMHKTLKTEGRIINISKDGEIDVDCGVYKEYSIEVEEWELVEEPVIEVFEQALETEWKGYVDRGAATVDALEDNTQELAFAKGFYRGSEWQKQQYQRTKELHKITNRV